MSAAEERAVRTYECPITDGDGAGIDEGSVEIYKYSFSDSEASGLVWISLG